jgi:hypothetical protein
MAFLSEEQIEQFETEYSKLRDDLLIHKETEPLAVYHRKLELANLMESAHRVFLHFAETGKVELEALD